ncbi:MAG: hypothetical protein ACMUJM_25620 [bacterium]
MENNYIKQKIDSQQNKFIRRLDLTPQIRLFIALTALMAKINSSWGEITQLSKQFFISRTFVYMLSSRLEESTANLFGDNQVKPPVLEQRLPYYYMLSLRLEGRCSIEAISIIMKRFGVQNSSVGFLSEKLNYFGSLLPSTLVSGEIKLLAIFFK